MLQDCARLAAACHCLRLGRKHHVYSMWFGTRQPNLCYAELDSCLYTPADDCRCLHSPQAELIGLYNTTSTLSTRVFPRAALKIHAQCTASHMALLHIATPQTSSIGHTTATPHLKLPDLHLPRPLYRPPTKHHVYNVRLSCYLRVLLFARCS
jgi:hypothetical protein